MFLVVQVRGRQVTLFSRRFKNASFFKAVDDTMDRILVKPLIKGVQADLNVFIRNLKTHWLTPLDRIGKNMSALTQLMGENMRETWKGFKTAVGSATGSVVKGLGSFFSKLMPKPKPGQRPGVVDNFLRSTRMGNFLNKAGGAVLGGSAFQHLGISC